MSRATKVLFPVTQPRERMLASASLEDDRALCLQRFSDAEIAQMAKAVFGFGSADAVAPWRKRLAITARR